MTVLYVFSLKLYIKLLFSAGCQACHPLITVTTHLYIIFTSLQDFITIVDTACQQYFVFGDRYDR